MILSIVCHPGTKILGKGIMSYIYKFCNSSLYIYKALMVNVLNLKKMMMITYRYLSKTKFEVEFQENLKLKDENK
jgi:hypothetical protein